MDYPPLNIYSQSRSPNSFPEEFKGRLPNAKIKRHPDGRWFEIQCEWKRGWLKKPLILKAVHMPEYYEGPDWAQQIAGMQNYFGQFPGAAARPDLFQYLRGLKFNFNFQLDPPPTDDDRDERLAVVFATAEWMDGIVFVPGKLLDAKLRVIISDDGEDYPGATVPAGHCVPARTRVEQVLEAAFGPLSGRASPPQPESPEKSIDARVESIMEAAYGRRPDGPPSQERVLARLQVLVALVNRGYVEAEDHSGTQGLWWKTVDDLKNGPAWREAEDWETNALECPLGKLGGNLPWRLPWLSEGAAVLACSLRLMDLPPYDEQVDVYELYEVDSKLGKHECQVALRSVEELQTLSAQMLPIHWRLRQFYLEPKATDFLAYSEKAWCGKMDLGLARLAGNDLEINGLPLSESPEKSWKCASGIMEERRKAVHWLLGEASEYSKTHAST